MPSKRIDISIDDYTLSMLDEFAKPRNISRSQLIRLAISEYIRNHTYSDAPPVKSATAAEALLRSKNEKPTKEAKKTIDRLLNKIKKGDMPFS